MLKKIMYLLSAIVSVLLVLASMRQWISLSMPEVLAFITGGLTVWLTVKENIWNWPIGIANSVFFVVLFWQARLFADMGLQVVYIILGFLGWYWWLFGGKNKTTLKVSKTTKTEIALATIITIVATYGLTIYLKSIQDSAPFLDALTTVMSLVAQYLLTKKRIENWFIWISVDVIYIGLYFYKHLYLTSILYLIFMIMCFAGLAEWRKSERNSNAIQEI